jgi:hypothetical protein
MIQRSTTNLEWRASVGLKSRIAQVLSDVKGSPFVRQGIVTRSCH